MNPLNPQVASHGYSTARIMFLGGFPLSADITSGLALSGPLFRNFFDEMLTPRGLSFEQCYKSIFVREKLAYSGTARPKLRAAMKDIDVEGYENLLFEDIKELAPNVIVPIDDIALEAVFPKIKNLTKPKNRTNWVYCYRGSVLPLRDDFQVRLQNTIRVIPTISPQLLMMDQSARSYVSLDFNRIVANQNNCSMISPYGHRWVAKSGAIVLDFINRNLARNPDFLVFDIETYGGILTCISFSFDGIEGCSIPLLDNTISISERSIMWRYVDKLLRHPIAKVNQNIKYDWVILSRFGFEVNNVVGDSMVLGSCLYPELPKGLDFYTSIYTPIPYYKDEGKDFDPKRQSRDTLYLYNAQDSIATHLVYREQLKELAEDPDLEKFYKTQLSKLIKPYKKMDERGIRIDSERKEKLIEKYKDLYTGNLTTLRALVGNDKFSPGSPKQVGKLIYEELKFKKRQKRTESGELNYVTDKAALDAILINEVGDNAYAKKIISRITVCKKLERVLQYLATPLSLDGRFRSTSNLCGTETGRSSYSKSLDEIFVHGELKRIGRSLQTISKHGFKIDDEVFEDFEDKSIAHDLRSMFVPSEGYIFVEADGSQAEARHVAVLAQDWELLESFDKKPKVHAKTAAMLFDVDVNIITKDFPSVPGIGIAYYDLGKRVRHAGNYAAEPGMISHMTHLPLGLCITMLSKFHAGNPQIREVFHAEVIKALQKERKLKTPYGRSRTFFGRMNADLHKEGIAYIPQSTVSDHTKLTIPLVLDAMPEVCFLAEQHDGLLMEVKTENRFKCAEVVKAKMERPLNYEKCTLSRDFELVVPAEISFGENWMDMEEVKI